MKRTISQDQDDDAVRQPNATVACLVPRDGKFLPVDEHVRGQLVLNQPAGHLESDGTRIQAASRKTREESGCEVKPDALVGVYQSTTDDRNRHFLRFTFRAKPVRHHPHDALDTGIVRALWMSRGEVAAAPSRPRSPTVLRCMDDWIDGRRQPLDTLVSMPATADA